MTWNLAPTMLLDRLAGLLSYGEASRQTKGMAQVGYQGRSLKRQVHFRLAWVFPPENKTLFSNLEPKGISQEATAGNS